jgi:PAS domain S-box-containing protein
VISADTVPVTSKSGEAAVRVYAPVEDDLHLRAVLEAQPVTLVRLGRDGKVLAVNEAGLAVIGAERLDQILETSLLDLLQQDDRNGFLAFIERVAKGHRGSLEVGLTAFTGTHHAIQIHAAPHPGAPDGIDSVLVTLRDVTESRRLEQSLVEAMARQADQEAAHEAVRQRLVEDLDVALQGKTRSEAQVAQIAELEDRVRAAETARASAVEQHTAELLRLKAALEDHQRISDEQRLRLEQFADVEARFAELTQRHSGAEAALGDVNSELEKSRIDAEAAQASLLRELQQTREDAESAQAALMHELDQTRADAEAMRTSLEGELERHRTLLETSRIDAETAQASLLRELQQTRENAEGAQAALMHELDQTRADAGAVRTSLEEELERHRTLLEGAHEDAARHAADVVALRDALNASMSEQAEAAARSRLEADAYAARLAVLETALAAAERAKQAATARLREVTQGTEQLVRRFIDQAAAADGVASGTPAGELGARLKAAITAAVDARLPVTVMVADPNVQIDAAPEIVQQALVALATNRAPVLAGGQVAIELAAVDVDEGAARSRGGMPCGAYVLCAMNVLSANAHAGLAPELFECPDGTVWESAGPTLFVAFESMRLARGWIWLAREGASGVVFELYLPRAAHRIKGEQG